MALQVTVIQSPRFTVRGEQRSAEETTAAAYLEELRTLVTDQQLCADQIYNCDETALYFKILPD
jgi:hypothetical protein